MIAYTRISNDYITYTSIGVMVEKRSWVESGGEVQGLGKNEETGLH